MYICLDAIRQKSNYKDNIFYKVVDEMLDIEIHKYRRLCMKTLRGILEKITPIIAASYMYLGKITNFFQ